ncbi:tp-dependent dna helicase recq [Diaporthe amygdali]|uniref:tp-dependent dna helicase recq n=1 Tax=Phomopsis amygdali TaxID=1214568 RepID=UPI0022FE21D9|nr:tp-dependent dna helicase recq [Diaporthe amygdali]KAJ0114137.1 tp-dependent dna helicase recq [Diaporthe amygdali]
MSDDFDSGDDLFDNVDVDNILQSSKAQATKRKSADKDDAPFAAKRQKKTTNSSVPGPQDDDFNPVFEKENIELARHILNEKFGYDDFRHEQKGAISRTLAGKSALVVFPTGAGKSLCYQSKIPAIAFPELDKSRGLREPGQSGITIVISPLIALMKDQVDALKRRGIAADCIDSTKSWEELQAIKQQLSRGELRMIYCSPERLNNERFVVSMKHVPGGVRLVAVDEAHCISEWGHSFRPEYLKGWIDPMSSSAIIVARFVEEINAERVVCLTATATAKVAEDVCKAFDIDETGVFRTSPYRPNLNLFAESVKIPSQKFQKLCGFLQKNPGPTLVYVTIQKESEDLALRLREHKFDATAFHAGMKVEQKTKVQDDFMANRVRIVIATIAFGMGVDKADIRNIVHYTQASTVEEYSQQIGRAGRDGRQSNCMFYLCNSDSYIRENFARGDLPSYEPFRKLIGDIFNDEVTALGVGATFKKDIRAQMNEFDIRQSPLSIIYATLELHYNLIRAITPEYSNYSFETTGPYHMFMDRMAKSDRPEARAILENSDKKTKLTHVDVNAIVRKTGYLRADIIQILDHLDRDNIIKLTAKGVVPKFRVLRKLPSSDAQLDELARKMYVDLEQRERDALTRCREVLELITGERCFAVALAEHFGMGLPDGKDECGHCTFCISGGKRVELPPQETKPLDREGIRDVLALCPVRDDPRFLARVAFGIMSPRVRELKLHQTPVWESMQDQDFDAIQAHIFCGRGLIEGKSWVTRIIRERERVIRERAWLIWAWSRLMN